jgi:hypothetical protein
MIVLNVLVPTKDKIDGVKYSFYKELECVINQFANHHMQILLRDFNAEVGTEEIFKPTIRNGILHENSNDNGIRVVNFDTFKYLIVKIAMFPHHSIHKFTWTSPDRKTHNQIDHILINLRWHSSVLDVRSLRGAGCDTTVWWWQNFGRDWQ